MKNISKFLILVLATTMFGKARSPNRAELLQELVRDQQETHSAIGWVDTNRLEFIVFSSTETIWHQHTLPEPAVWAASIHGPSGEIFGDIGPGVPRVFAAVKDGKVLWENPDLILQQQPEISPSGELLLFKGKDRKAGTEGLLLVQQQGQTATLISPEGSDPSWSADDTRFVYSEKGEIVVYDLQSKQRHPIARGNLPTWSPDGRWISYRTPKGQFVLVDPNGNSQRTLLNGKHLLTPLHWSPDSKYFMYVKESGWGCNPLMVYKLEDGQSAEVYKICQGSPFLGLRWVRMPSDVSFD